LRRRSRQYRSLHDALPGVAFYYALKPLPNAAVVAELRDLGANFDLATTGEIKLVKAAGIAPERCIHTHPIKSDADIRAALRFGIRTFVADNPDEIRKFARHRRRAELLLRVSFRQSVRGGRPVAQVRLRAGCRATTAGVRA
jgi:ornithine decarboxylase